MPERLVSLSTDSVIVERLEYAGGPLGRMRGLLGTRSLPPGRGLLIPRARQVHTFGMRYAIDVVFLDRSMTVVHVVREMRPNRISRLVWRSRMVVETPAGAAAAVQVGELLQIEGG